MQQQPRSAFSVSDVSKFAKDFKEHSFLEWLKPFVQLQKSKSHFLDRTDDLETNGRESDENGSDRNSDFGEDQDKDG